MDLVKQNNTKRAYNFLKNFFTSLLVYPTRNSLVYALKNSACVYMHPLYFVHCSLVVFLSY